MTMSLDADRIQKPARKLLKRMPEVPSPEDIHDFRTNSRRIETSLAIFSSDSRLTRHHVAKEISKLRKRAGKVRDMDVLTAYLSGLEKLDSEQECLVRLLEYLGAQREKHNNRFQKTRRRRHSHLRRGLQQVAKKLGEAVSGDQNDASAAEGVSAKVAASALAMLAQLKAPPRLGRTNLHSYRLKIKELRNLLQLAENSNQQEFVDCLGDVKDAIGEWHDWEVLGAIAKDVLNHGNSCRLVQRLGKIVVSKYRRALRLAVAMRRDFLHLPAKYGSGARKLKEFRPGEPVWSAAAALAA
jgi:CHAD domain-containing protein